MYLSVSFFLVSNGSLKGGCQKLHLILTYEEPASSHKAYIRAYQKTMAIQSRGESRQIVANRGKFHSKNNGNQFCL